MHKRRLDSWKAIAEFLGRSLRTVQRWHDLNGLPVHHFGGQRGSVFAYEDEIDAWLACLAEKDGLQGIRTDEHLESAKRTSRELTTTADSMWQMRSIKNIQTITDLYRKAIDNDSGNASAFIGLANAIIFCAINGLIDGSIAFPMAQDALRRIPPLEADRADAKCPAAWIDLLYNRNWRQARAGFEDVVRNRPSSSFARSGLGLAITAEGNLDEAIACAWEAWRLNPLVRSLGGILCWITYLKGEFDHVLDLTAQMRSSSGHGPVTSVVEALVLAQAPNSAADLARLEKSAQEQPENQLLAGALGYAYAAAGDDAKARSARALLLRSIEAGMRSNGYPLALVCLALGDKQEAISWLEAAYAGGSVWSLGFRTDPILRSLRGQHRFECLLSQIGASDSCVPVSELNASMTGASAGELLVAGNS